MQVVIDGITYVPAAEAPASVGVAITTRNRHDVLAQALDAHAQYSQGLPIVVVDDGSDKPVTVPDGVTLIRHETSRGIVAAKNTSLTALMDLGVDYLALWDDDAWPISSDWWKPYADSPEAHMAYQFLDLSGARKLNDITVQYQDDRHIAYTGQRGVMLWYRRDAIEQVGGFDPIYGRGMYEHSDLASRIHAAGLTSLRYMDVTGSDKLIYSLDEHEAVERSVPRADRQALVKRNAEIHNRRMDTGDYPAFVPYRGPRNVVLTCLYGRDQDPQRKGQTMTLADVGTLAKSVKGASLLVTTDLDGTIPGATIRRSELSGVNVFFKRWLDAYQYLRDRPDIQWAAVVDATDVEMLHEPWADLEPGILYVGSEPTITANTWMRQKHPDPAVQAFIDEHPHDQLLNAGVVIGDRETVMRFAHKVASHYFNRQRNRFYKRDTAGPDLGDMGAFNLIARRDFTLSYGPRVTTVFRSEERNGWSWWRHK